MPCIPTTIEEKSAWCPYCDGEIEYDVYSNRIFCNRCMYTCICIGLDKNK